MSRRGCFALQRGAFSQQIRTSREVAQVAQIFGRVNTSRGMSELNPFLPSFRRPPASRGCAFM